MNTLFLVPTRTSYSRRVKTETYTPELAKKTESVGDCCMKSTCEWGHARLAFEEDVNDFDDQDHMDFVGEFSFSVNETCLSCDHNIIMVAPTDTDAHNPLLVHLQPSDMRWKEKHAYAHPAKKIQRKERRKDIQKSNKRKGQGFGDGPLLDESWNNRVVDQRGHKTPTLAMGTPQLCQQGNGDRRNDERILLEGEDNTR